MKTKTAPVRTGRPCREPEKGRAPTGAKGGKPAQAHDHVGARWL